MMTLKGGYFKWTIFIMTISIYHVLISIFIIDSSTTINVRFYKNTEYSVQNMYT